MNFLQVLTINCWEKTEERAFPNFFSTIYSQFLIIFLNNLKNFQKCTCCDCNEILNIFAVECYKLIFIFKTVHKYSFNELTETDETDTN